MRTWPRGPSRPGVRPGGSSRPTPRVQQDDGPRVERYEIRPFTVDEARDDRLRALYPVALAMGLRQGEALGLRWQDIDLAAGFVHVN